MEEQQFPVDGPAEDEILAINEGLEKLAEQDEQVARLVKMRYFGGLPIPRSLVAPTL